MKKLCALVLTLGLLLTCFTTSVYALDSYADAKIDSNLTAALYESSSDTATAYVTMAGLDEETFMDYFQEHYPVDHAVYMYAKYDVEPQLEGLGEITDEMIQNAIETKRAVYKELNSEYSNEIIGRYYDSDEILFVSSYAPVAIVETDLSTLTLLSRTLDVSYAEEFIAEEYISLDESSTNESSSITYLYDRIMDGIDHANSVSRADIVRDDKNMTGSGIKIGVLEAGGIPDVANPYLSSSNITIRPGDTIVDDHATIVTSILVAKETDGTLHGIVPDAEVYCCWANRGVYSSIEWLLDNGVNIINASLGVASTRGYYDPFSRWVDHIAIQHDVHFVKSAGNAQSDWGDYCVTSPGMAYNAITVGNFDSYGSVDISQFEMVSGSCYEEVTNGTARAEKPNLVANGCFQNAKISYGSLADVSGTSYAAPQVAGVIAQLCDYTSGLKTKQTQMGAILSASSAKKIGAVGSGEKGDIFTLSTQVEDNEQVSNIEGAGVLDARWAWGVVVNHNHWTANMEEDDYSYTKTVTIDTSKFELIRVAIFWPKRNTVTDHTNGLVDYTTNPMSDLDLYVYAPDGTLLGHSSLTYANFEIVQFVPPETGEYEIRIIAYTPYAGNVGISVW